METDKPTNQTNQANTIVEPLTKDQTEYNQAKQAYDYLSLVLDTSRPLDFSICDRMIGSF